MRNCELCKRVAWTHCESDQAYLCWSCDFKVHSANFLVARHSRTLLCRACQSPTPWTAAGSSFGPTLSVCRDCFVSYKFTAADDEESRAENEIVEEEEEEEEVGNSDEDVDIQVVPWSPSTPPPNSEGEGEGESCRSSSSSSSPTRFGAQLKRKHEVDTDIRLNGVSYLDTVADGGSGRGKIMRVGSLEETRLTKRRVGSTGEIRVGLPGSRTWGIVDSIVRLDRSHRIQGSTSAAMISRLCSLG